MSRGKDVHGFLDAIRGSAASLTATTASHDRSMQAADLAQLAATVFRGSGHHVAIDVSPKPSKALETAIRRAGAGDIVCAAGSFFLLGDLYSEYVRHEAV
jgi:folylpolyglutamate synthase/dihydropteroate synthase